MTSVLDAAQDYIAAGWALCAIPRNLKKTVKKGWQRRENAITDPITAKQRITGNVGLCHAWSGTCAIDFDELDVALDWLREKGVDGEALLAADDAVMITSGRPNRAKLLYRLPAGVSCLPTKKPFGRALEFRCGTAERLTMQDVLPPSIHPDTGKPYEWAYNNDLIGDWRYPPVLPDALYQLWLAACNGVGVREVADEDDILMQEPPLGLSSEDLGCLLRELDPDAPYDSDDPAAGSWLKVGMALHHETGGSAAGFALWDTWSARGDKYKGSSDLEKHWASFGSRVYPVTAKWLKKVANWAQRDTAVPVLTAKDVMESARKLREHVYSGPDGSTLLRHAGHWYGHAGACYVELSEEAVRCQAWRFLDRALKVGKSGPEPFMPSAGQVTSCTDALRALVHAGDVAPPLWLGETAGPAPETLIALANGLLHVPTRRLLPHTPAYFNLNALPFDWAADAPAPTRWLAFLDDLWGDDPESIDALQQMFGYLLGPDTRQQKMFLLLGPKRSGKGTIGRVLAALLGAANVVGPTLGSLCGGFGLQPLIGKLAAIIPDARLGPRLDSHAVVERMLMISGEDNVTIDRKNTTAWSGKLTARFVLMTNEIPRFADSSGALASRFVVLETRHSWYGKEDINLDTDLMAELPGIFLWALAGRDRLAAAGRFTQPASSMEVVREIAEITSPVSAFLRDCCLVEPGQKIACLDLFDAWRSWCASQGRQHPGTVTMFGRDLRAALGNAVRTINPAAARAGGGRWYSGIGLREGVADEL